MRGLVSCLALSAMLTQNSVARADEGTPLIVGGTLSAAAGAASFITTTVCPRQAALLAAGDKTSYSWCPGLTIGFGIGASALGIVLIVDGALKSSGVISARSDWSRHVAFGPMNGGGTITWTSSF